MALEMKAGSRWWYLRYRDGKKIRQVRLKVPVRGQVPSGPDDDGDRVFCASKAEAEAEHDRVLVELRGDPSAEKAIQRIVQLKTGGKVEFPSLDDLCKLWERIPRRKQPHPQYAHQCKTVLNNFAAFIHKNRPEIGQFVQVTPALAQAYLDDRQEQGVATKTWNDSLKILRATFKHLHPHLADGQNPFHRMLTRTLDTVNRQPFTPEELRKILDSCAHDDFIRPIIVTGMCTAMRRGDCCLLKWVDVDLKAGFITVKTSKTGETIDIPILALFRDELLKAEVARDAAGTPSEYVFPEPARMYLGNSDGITLRVQRVLAAALGGPKAGVIDVLPELTPEEARRRGLEYLGKLKVTTKTKRMRAVFDLYMDGKSIKQVAATGISKGSVSGHLGEIEAGAGCQLVRGRHDGVSFSSWMRTDNSVLHARRQNGARRASIRGFHSFRVTWVTIALAAGVPLEIVQRVTGHKTVDVVLKHYFRPGREDFRRTLENAMPRLFMESARIKALPAVAVVKDPKAEILSICARATAKSWKKDMERITELAARV